jgi:hypothetical protein
MIKKEDEFVLDPEKIKMWKILMRRI